MRAVVGRNDAHVVHRFVEQCDLLLVLDDLHRIEAAGLIELPRDSGKMATRLGILVAPFEPVGPFRSGFRRVRVLRRRRPAAAATTSTRAPGREMRSVERADEQSLNSTGALHPQA